MRGWQKKQYEPPNCDIVIIKHLNEQEKNRQAKQDLKEQLAMCDTYKLTREKLKLLEDLCKEHDMVDYTTTEVKRDDRQLIDQFVHSTHGAFQAYKKGSSINRTLHQLKYKKKPVTEEEIKIKEVIEFERNNLMNKRRRQKQRFTVPKHDATMYENLNMDGSFQDHQEIRNIDLNKSHEIQPDQLNFKINKRFNLTSNIGSDMRNENLNFHTVRNSLDNNVEMATPNNPRTSRPQAMEILMEETEEDYPKNDFFKTNIYLSDKM